MSDDLSTVRSWLSGTFSNREQAMAQPAWFIPVRLRYLPVDHLFASGVGWFTEQMSEHLGEPYRSRVLHLLDQPLRFENYRLKDQKVWAGAAFDPPRLAQLAADDLILLPGCTIFLERTAAGYSGRMAEGRGCRLSAEDTSYVLIEFELSEDCFLTLDRGFDLVSDAQTWGSRAGAYCYRKLPV